ncbi:MAG: NAD-dependent epimerase/dehydratase family protein [Candidatus Competibacteraceae bacterium]
MTRVLITGASGALGRAVIADLCRREGYSVITVGRRQSSSPDVVSYWPCDMRDPQQLATVLDQAQPDWVLHLAATFADDLIEARAVNVEPAQQILEWVRRGERMTRVVLVGSAAEYGVVRPEENPVREERVLVPVSAYGVSKAWQTQLAGYFARSGVDVVCARIFNLHGPGISDRLFAGRLDRQIGEVLAGHRSVIEVGPLDAIRDYLDTATAAVQLSAIAHYGCSGEIYHVASGIPLSMQEFLKRELASAGLDSVIVREAAALSNHRGYDVPVIYADLVKTQALLQLSEHP